MNTAILNALTTAINDALQRLSGGTGAMISSMQIDPLLGELIVTYTDNDSVNLGRVVGESGADGDDGVSVINVELVEDPEQNNAVFIQTELSNGVILQSQRSLNGYHGKSLSDAYVDQQDQLRFVLEGGEELLPIPIEGLTPISIVGARIDTTGPSNELYLEMSNGTEINAGVVADLAGRGIVNFTKGEDGIFYVEYTDNPGVQVPVGNGKAIQSVDVVNGKLTITYDNSEPAVEVGTFMSFTGAAVVDGNLVLSTNQPAPNDTIDLGPVQNLKGDQGVGIASVTLEGNELVFTLTDASTSRVPVSGLTPISVTGARYDVAENEVYLTLSDGSEVTTGIGSDFRGVGVSNVTFDSQTGEIKITYTNDVENPVTIGTIPVMTNVEVLSNGQMQFEWSNDPGTKVQLTNIKSIASIATASDGTVVVTFNDSSEQTLGTIRSVESANIVAGQLQISYTDGTTEAVGMVKGDKGDTGLGIKHVEINPGGNLILTMDDDSTIDAGFARTTVQNLLGRTVPVTATAGQTTFNVAHEGQILPIRAGQIDALADYDLSVSDQITYTGSQAFTEGEEVLFVVYVAGGPSETGRGVFDVTVLSPGVYSVQLEDGSTFTIDTNTTIDPATLPPGIASAQILPNGDLEITLTDNSKITAGQASKAINTKSAVIDENGDLIITLDDDTVINAGSVVSDLTVTGARVDENGDLIITISGGTEFNAGQTGQYITGVTIDENDALVVTLSDGSTINAGSVRNPLLGSIYDFVAFDGQVDFPCPHNGFQVMVYVNGASLGDAAIDTTTDPNFVRLTNPRNENDVVRILLVGAGNSLAAGLQSESDAGPDTYYGKDAEGNVGWHPSSLQRLAQPIVLTAAEGQTTFSVSHSGTVNVFVNGALKYVGPTNDYTLPSTNRQVVFNNGLTEGDKVMVEVLSPPVRDGNLLTANFARVGYQSYTEGGTFLKGKWQLRSLNTIWEDGIGVQLSNNRLILPAGDYYIEGYAACNGVRQNVLRAYNQTNSVEVVKGGPVFAAPRSGAQFDTPDCRTPISGYFSVPNQAAILLQHKCVESISKYGFGTSSAGGRLSSLAVDSLGEPGRLVELKIWKLA